jgi:hypothetical protein
MCDSAGSKTINNPINVTVYLEDGGGGGTTGDGSALYNLNASNIASGHVNSSLIYGNTLSNINASNIVGTVPSSVFGNLLSNLNASNLAFGHVNSSLIYGNTLSNISASNISGLMTVSGNTLSNINASNLAFGIVNSSLIYGNTLSNISASNITGLMTVTGNTLSNLNASNLAFGIVNSTLIYGNTLSNINSSNITQPFTNLVVSNTVTTGNVIIGKNVTATQGILHVELGNTFIGNSYWVGTNSTNSVVNGPTRLVFDNTTTPYSANKILLHSNTASQNICGFGVTGVYNTVPISLSYYTSGDHSFAIGSNQNFGGYEVFAIRNNGQVDIGGTKQAKLHLGGSIGIPSNNTMMRIDSSNVALVTNGAGLVGFGTTAPSANLHVIGNVYASNALSTTNLSATTANVGTLNVISISNLNSLTTNLSATTANVGTLNVISISNLNSLALTNNLYAANAVTTTNIFAAGFTSNSANTIFNYSTLTVPFINSTTLNVASTSNIATANILIANVVTGIYSPAVYGGAYYGGTFAGSTVSGTTITASTGFTGAAYTGGTFYGGVHSGTTITASTGFTGAAYTGGTFQGTTITASTGFTGAAYTGGTFYGGVHSGTTITASTGFTGAAYTGGTFQGSIQILSGTAGATSLNTTGNIYVSNALSTTNVFATTVSTTNPISFRNRVINGDFLIDQRNSGASSTPTVDPTRTIDRWKVNIFGSGRCLVGQNLGAFAYPAGFTSYYGMKVTTTTSVGANDYFFLSQVVEGVNAIDWQWGTANAKTVTLSFWVQSSLTGTAGGFVRNAGSSASNYSRSYPFTFTINNVLTWEYKTVTIPGDTGTPWYTTQTDGVEFGIELWNGSTYQASPGAWAAGNYTGPSGGTINYAGTLNSVMNITGVQIELGNVATQFERRLYNFELAACQRYYEPTIARMGGYNTTGNYLRSSVYFNTKKRAAASPIFTVISTPETVNMGSLNIDNSNFDGSSARILASVTATGDAFGQWKVSVDCEF